MKRLVVFASGAGSTFEYLVHHAEADYSVVGLFCNRAQAEVITLAKDFSIPVIMVQDGNWRDKLRELKPDLIVLAGYLKLLPEDVATNYRVINTHPALLPRFGGKGLYGHHVHEAVLAAGESTSGVSVHWVDSQYDHGEVIAQAEVAISPSETPDSLATKVQAVEKPLLHETIKRLLEEQ